MKILKCSLSIFDYKYLVNKRFGNNLEFTFYEMLFSAGNKFDLIYFVLRKQLGILQFISDFGGWKSQLEIFVPR